MHCLRPSLNIHMRDKTVWAVQKLCSYCMFIIHVFYLAVYHTINYRKRQLIFSIFSDRIFHRIFEKGQANMDSIIFDLDGTLWDSTAIVARAWTEYLTRTEHMDILITEERLKSLFGRPMPQIAEMVFPDQSPAEQLRLLDGCCQAEHQALLKQCAPLYEDLENTLQSLSQKFPFILSAIARLAISKYF